MIYINPAVIDHSLPDNLKQQLHDANEELKNTPEAERSRFIKAKEKLWQDLKPHLAKVLGKNQSENDFKCWYCEAKTARFIYHVDHFRPKYRVKDKQRSPEQGYWWLALDYTNYRLSCEFCNSPHSDEDDDGARGKWDQFPLKDDSKRAHVPDDNLDKEARLLIDPTKIGEAGLLSFNIDGHIKPTYDEGFLKEKAKRSIEVLNLDQTRIVEARKQIHLLCMRLVDDGDKEFKKLQKDGDVVAQGKYEDKCIQLMEMVEPWSEFSAMARSSLKSKQLQWVTNLIQTS
jgi:uncharacterized protein (TIGR02646 family)